MSSNRYLRDIPLPGLEDGPVGYRGPQVCKVVGITYRQLDYWTTTGLIRPSIRDAEGSGSQRLYAFDDIVQLKVVKRLLDAGISLQQIRKALDWVREHDLSLSNVTLIADAKQVYALTEERDLLDVIKRGQGVFALDVGPVVEEAEAQIMRMPAERAAPATLRRRRGEPQAVNE